MHKARPIPLLMLKCGIIGNRQTYPRVNILPGYLQETFLQAMLYQFRSVVAQPAGPTADSGSDQGHPPALFQSGCKSQHLPVPGMLENSQFSCPSQRA